VIAGIAAERLGGVGGADDENNLHPVQCLGDVGGDRLQRSEPFKHTLSLDTAAFADRHQMVVMGGLCIQGDPVSLARPLVGDRQPSTARPQHRDVHETDSIRARVPGIVDGNLPMHAAPHSGLARGECRCRGPGSGGPSRATRPCVWGDER
jgi:hypothetical protein